MQSHEPVVFKIDQDDDIVAVNAAWDTFALENDAPELIGVNVVGRSLWDFISDGTTCQLYKELLVHVRGGVTVRFPLRCDSPGLRRYLEMVVRPAEDATVGFESHLVASLPRVKQLLWDRQVHRSRDLVRVCSWCKRVDVSGEWREVEDAIAQLALFEERHPPQMTHGICPSCMERMLAKTVALTDPKNLQQGRSKRS